MYSHAEFLENIWGLDEDWRKKIKKVFQLKDNNGSKVREIKKLCTCNNSGECYICYMKGFRKRYKNLTSKKNAKNNN